MAATEKSRRIHAQAVVALARHGGAGLKLEAGIRDALDGYCDTIRNGPDELSDDDVEALRFLTAVRTELAGGPSGSDG